MLVKNTKKTKRSKVLSVVAIVLVVITAIVVYMVFLKKPEPTLVNADQVLLRKSLDTSFSVELLEDEQFKNLKLYGPQEVKVQLRGRKADPFQAF